MVSIAVLLLICLIELPRTPGRDIIESWPKFDMRKAPVDFKITWCKQRMSRYDWQNKLQPCLSRVPWEVRQAQEDSVTDPTQSFIQAMDINPAAYYGRIVIQSVSVLGETKTIGGDFWRVNIRGPSNVAATVADRDDGTYEAVFLVLVPGEYQIQAVLDYSMCRGIKDPPLNWFKTGCLHGSFQSRGSLHGRVYDYINKPLLGGKNITIDVEPPPTYTDKALETFKSGGHLGCKDKCNVLWDGYGTWDEEVWTPYAPGPSLSLGGSGHPQGQGILWVFGDSLNRYFFESISRRPLCWKIFRACYFTMTWVYALQHIAKEEMDLKFGGKNINIPRILTELREVVTRTDMDENSALVLNTGVHLLKSTGFYNYQRIVRGMVSILTQFYRGQVIWKTTTSIQDQRELYSGCFRRFHTEQRIDLFNAFAMTAMCRAGFLVLDVYPLTSSYPAGTVDGIHYNSTVFISAEDVLESYFES